MKKVNFLWKLKIVHFQNKAMKVLQVNKLKKIVNSQNKNFQKIQIKYFKDTNNIHHLELKRFLQ